MCAAPVGRRAESVAQRRCWACTDQLLPVGTLSSSLSLKYAGLLNLDTVVHADSQGKETGAYLAVATSVAATGTKDKLTNAEARASPVGREKDLVSWSTLPEDTVLESISLRPGYAEQVGKQRTGASSPLSVGTPPSTSAGASAVPATSPALNAPDALCTSKASPSIKPVTVAEVKDVTPVPADSGKDDIISPEESKKVSIPESEDAVLLAHPGASTQDPAQPAGASPVPTSASLSPPTPAGSLAGSPALLTPSGAVTDAVQAPGLRSTSGKSFAPPEPPSPVGSVPVTVASSSAGSDSSSLSGGPPSAEEIQILEAQQRRRLFERKRTLARLLRPQDEQDITERMRLNTLWAQFIFCFECGEKWSFHTVQLGCLCTRTLSLQMQEVERDFGAIPGLEDS